MPWSDEHRQAPYVLTQVENDYDIFTGKIAMPVAFWTGGGKTAGLEVVCASRPYGKRVMRFFFSRRHAKPKPPKPDLGPGEVLIRARIGTVKKTKHADGVTSVFTIEGEYLIYRDRPYEEFPAGKGPEDEAPAGEVVYKTTDFTSDYYRPPGDTGGSNISIP